MSLAQLSFSIFPVMPLKLSVICELFFEKTEEIYVPLYPHQRYALRGGARYKIKLQLVCTFFPYFFVCLTNDKKIQSLLFSCQYAVDCRDGFFYPTHVSCLTDKNYY